MLHTFEGTCVHTPVYLNACILYLCSDVYLGGDHDVDGYDVGTMDIGWPNGRREIIATKKTTKH